MKQIGIEKNIDKLSRILIPKHIRETIGFELNKPIEMIITNEGLLLRKSNASKKESDK